LKVLLSNDDSYLSPGLYLLYESVKDLCDTLMVSTQYPKSATGREITFDKPLRLYKTKYLGYEVFVTDGTPIDAIHLAIEVLGFKPDLVLSGVNVGENLSLQHIFYSGTVGVAIEAALMGIPAIAISADVYEFSDFYNENFRELIKRLVRMLTINTMKFGFPKGVDVLSINIPRTEHFRNCYRVVRAARIRWRARYRIDRDVRGNICYWLQGEPEVLEVDTDVYSFEREGCVTISPITVDLNSSPEMLRYVERLVSGEIS